jgi:hypothetical protein
VKQEMKLSLQIGGTSTWKKRKVETDTTASYDLTLFFTDSEANQLSGNDLSIIKVNGNAIDDASSSANIFKQARHHCIP